MSFSEKDVNDLLEAMKALPESDRRRAIRDRIAERQEKIRSGEAQPVSWRPRSPDPFGLGWAWLQDDGTDVSEEERMQITAPSPSTTEVPAPPARARGRPRWRLVALAAAALLLVGVGFFFGKGNEREELFARLVPEGVAIRGAGPSEAVESDSSLVYRLHGDFKVLIRSPRSGYATLIIDSAGGRKVLPAWHSNNIFIKSNINSEYLLEQVSGKTEIFVVVTQAPAADTVRSALARRGAVGLSGTQLQDYVRDVLWGAGFRWVASDHIAVEPDRQRAG